MFKVLSKEVNMSFLKAEWRKLLMANYEIDPKVLLPHVPAGTELDLWDGKCFVSLVGFLFLNTKVLGLKIPFHTNFEEVNLRFYVKRFVNNEWRRGVVFIKEIVPKAALTLIANAVYKEHYETQNMNHSWLNEASQLTVKYEWGKKELTQRAIAICSDKAQEIMAGSKEEFIAEHYWGYAKINNLTTNEYEVVHPKWTHYPVLSTAIDVDFKAKYGNEFEPLNKMKPSFTLLAEGSTISVEQKNQLIF